MTAIAAPARLRRVSVRRIVTWVLPLVAVGALAIVLVDRRHAFVTALDAAPVWLLTFAVLLQLLALLARSEASRLCVGAAGSTVSRRGTFRASAFGGLVGIVNGQAGIATRIAALRRAPGSCPRVGALLAVLRTFDGRSRVVGLVVTAIFSQIARNRLALHGIGFDASVFDAVTLAAAAGVLLTATGMAGTLCFGGWAVADRLRPVRAVALP